MSYSNKSYVIDGSESIKESVCFVLCCVVFITCVLCFVLCLLPFRSTIAVNDG